MTSRWKKHKFLRRSYTV